MTDSSPSTPQVKRKLVESESEAFEPEQKTARTSDDDDELGQEVTAEEAAVAEVQELLTRRKAAAKEEIERQYEEISMAPEGQHSDFLKEIQGRAEIVNKGAVQNEGFKGKFLDNLAGLGDADNTREDDDEAAALAIIRGTHTGIEDASVAALSNKDAKEKMHEVTGIPRGLKFEINISPEDVDPADEDQADGIEIGVDINLDVVVASPRLNTDMQKSRSALAHKGMMKNRRLPVRTLPGSKLITDDITKEITEVIAKEEVMAQAEDVKEDSKEEEPVVTSKPVMSTADKVRQALAEKMARPAREEKKPNAQQQVPDWVLARQQKEILKQSSKPDAEYAAIVRSGEQIETAKNVSTSITTTEEQDKDERQFKPSLSKLAALERPRKRTSQEVPAHQVMLRKTSGSSREGSIEKDVRPPAMQVKKHEKESDQVRSRSITPDKEHVTVSQVKRCDEGKENGTKEQTTINVEEDLQKKEYSGVQLRKASLEDKGASSSRPGFTAIPLKSTVHKRRSFSPISDSKPELSSLSKQADTGSSQVSDNIPAFAKIRLRTTGTRLSLLERELTNGDSNDKEVNEGPATKPEMKKEPAQGHEVKDSRKSQDERLPKPTSNATLFAKKRTPSAGSHKPVVSNVTDDVPAWKKALMERRKSSKAAPIPHATKQDVPLDPDRIPQWKRDLMMRKKKTDDKIKIDITSSEPNTNSSPSQEPAWFRDLQNKRKGRTDSSTSVTQLSTGMARVSVTSVTDDDKNVPSFIREFEGRRKKSATPALGPEPEWKKQLDRKKSEQGVNGGKMV